jgi:hypothetical protein
MLAGVLFVSLASLQLRDWPWAPAMNVTVAVWLTVGALLLPEATPLTILNHVLSGGAVLTFTWLASRAPSHDGADFREGG